MARLVAAVLAASVLAESTRAAPTRISSAPAYYPRLLPLNASRAVGVVEKPAGATRRLVFVARSANGTWSDGAVVAADSSPDADLANGHVLALADGTLLAAYRHHTGSGASRVFRIQVSASSDGGATWALRSTVAAGPTGVWEPFLFHPGGDVSPATVRVLYAAELTNGGEQDVVGRTSLDGGRTWSGEDVRVHTPNARNGMPGVSPLPPAGARLVLVFERPTRAGPGAPFSNFTVQSSVSTDGGATWGASATVHAPADGAFNAGSPQVAACANGRRAVAVFMSDEGGAGGRWPDGARVWASYADAAGGAGGALEWGAGAALPAATASVYWPSLLRDGDAVRVVYQGDDAAAYVSGDGASGGGVCA